MVTMASQITSLTIVYSTVYSGADQRKHQSSALLALCVENLSVTGGFPAQMASNAENGSIWWRQHGTESSLVQAMAWLPEPKLKCCWLGCRGRLWIKTQTFSFTETRLKMSSSKRRPFYSGSNIFILESHKSVYLWCGLRHFWIGVLTWHGGQKSNCYFYGKFLSVYRLWDDQDRVKYCRVGNT